MNVTSDYKRPRVRYEDPEEDREVGPSEALCREVIDFYASTMRDETFDIEQRITAADRLRNLNQGPFRIQREERTEP